SREAVEVKKHDFTPEVDFAVPLELPDGGQRLGLRHQNLAVARITPITQAQPDRPDGVLILFDSSASRALGYSAQVDRLSQVVAELGHAFGVQLPLKIACFDQEVVEVYRGDVGGYGANVSGTILQ